MVHLHGSILCPCGGLQGYREFRPGRDGYRNKDLWDLVSDTTLWDERLEFTIKECDDDIGWEADEKSLQIVQLVD